LDAVKQHLAEGEELNAKEKNNFLRYAAYWGRKEIAELFIAKGAKVNAKNDAGETSLHQAAYSGKTDVVELLIAKGADVNAKSKAGHTPLFWAISNHNNEVADLIRMHRKMPLKPRLEYSNGQLAIDGKVGREYEVLFSTELKEWQVLETLRLEASPQVYVDKQTADQPIRFYQLRLVE
jgi:ankyrin repeat protein